MSDNEISEEGMKLAERHWEYIEKLLTVHGEELKIIGKIKFHYIQAMKHGYKHGKSCCSKLTGEKR